MVTAAPSLRSDFCAASRTATTSSPLRQSVAVVAPVRQHERSKSHVLYGAEEMALALAGHRLRHLPQQHQDDRDVMRGEIPHHVGVMLEQPQVGSHRTDVEHLADLALGNELAQLLHW